MNSCTPHRVSDNDGTTANSDALREQSVRWTWRLCLRWSIVLSIAALGVAIIAVLGFFLLIAIPVAYVFDVPLARYAFHIPFLIVPAVWTVGMVRCYRQIPSVSLMLALFISGIAFYAGMPAILFVIVIISVGGWNVR